MIRILILNLFIFLHPLHVTLTTISKETGSDTLKVFFRMYYDDFLLDYKLFNPGFKSAQTNDTTDYPRENLNAYFNDRVQLSINNKLLPGRITGVSISSYEILLDIIYYPVRKARNIMVRNQVLTRIYEDQANMIYLNINKYEDALKLTVGNVEETVKLK